MKGLKALPIDHFLESLWYGYLERWGVDLLDGLVVRGARRRSIFDDADRLFKPNSKKASN